ncbi:MAG: LamG domain-containing protein [Polyangiaceae bacterium]
MNGRVWGVLALGVSMAACANPVDDTGGTAVQAPQGGGSLAPAPVKGGYDGNVATGLPSGSAGATGAGGEGGAGGDNGSGGGGVEPPTHPEPGLTLSFDFEGSMGYAFDVSGSGNHSAPPGPGVNISAAGKNGQGASFTGGGGSIVVNSSSSLDFKSGATIEFWVKLASVQSGTIVSRGIAYGGNSVRVRTTQGNLQVVFSGAAGGSTTLTSSPNLLGTTWTHVAIVNDGSELELYINGELETSVAGGYLGALSSSLIVGKSDSSDLAMTGTLDELKWWTVARSPAEICADAGGTFGGSACSLP